MCPLHTQILSYKTKRRVDETLPSVPRVAVSMALFTLNFLNLDEQGHSAAERHSSDPDRPKEMVKWKDVLTGQWKGPCLLYTSDAADDSLRVDLGGRRIIKKIFFKQKTAYEISLGLVGSEMCIRDRFATPLTGEKSLTRDSTLS